MIEGVSFIVPVHNGASLVGETIEAIAVQVTERPMEILVIDDGSCDGSPALLRDLAGIWPIRILPGEGRGAAAAINTGVRAARFPIVCQLDQDVVPEPGWMELLCAELDDPGVAAAQGYYRSDRRATLCARAMGFDLEQRYGAIVHGDTDHVCTGNTAYRAEALQRVGLFDETLGYGYDNDISYRLTLAGYRLRLCREAGSLHRWREGLLGYMVQQYGFGYGRLDLVAKHPERFTGDAVSPAAMMAHPLVCGLAIVGLIVAALAGLLGAPAWPIAAASLIAVAGLALERLAAGMKAALRFRDLTPLVFPFVHLARDLAWVAAIAIWSARRLLGQSPHPSHSMQARRPAKLSAELGVLRVRPEAARQIVAGSTRDGVNTRR